MQNILIEIYFYQMDKLKQKFIEKHASLFWYIPSDKKMNISDALLVESILNYGSMNDVKELIAIMGIEQVAKVFFSAKGRAKNNYYPEIYNFFTLLFHKYVTQRDS